MEITNINDYNVPNSEERDAAQADLERLMANKYPKMFYELATNFPTAAKNITYDCEKIKNDLHVWIKQDGKVLVNTLKDLIGISDNFTKKGVSIGDIKSRGAGGMFGIGTNTIKSYTKDYKISFRDCDGIFQTLDCSTGMWSEVGEEFPKSLVGDDIVVVQRFIIPAGGSTLEQKLEEWKVIIGRTDAKAILKGYTHQFNVTGFGNELNDQFSGEVKSLKIIWENVDPNQIPTAKYPTLFKKDGTMIKDVEVKSVTNFNNHGSSITFTVLGLGMRGDKNKLYSELGEIKDQPWAVVYMKGGREQLAGFLPLRTLGGKQHINNVMIEACVDKDEVKRFYKAPDKFEGFNDSLKDKFLSKFQPLIENTYKDDSIIEQEYQEFLYDIIVYDTYGEVIDEWSADQHRKLFGLSWMNDLTPQQRKLLVTKEAWINKDSRLDIVIVYPKHISGELEDLKTIIECKRLNFNKNDIKQSNVYVSHTRGCKHIYGFSSDINDTNKNNWIGMLQNISNSNQFRLGRIEGNLIDIKDHAFRFGNVSDHYKEKVQTYRETLKNSKSTKNAA